MGRRILTVTVADEVYNKLISRKTKTGKNLSNTVEELITEGLLSVESRSDSIKSNILALIKVTKHIEKLMDEKERKDKDLQ